MTTDEHGRLTDDERRQYERIEDDGDTQGLAWRVQRTIETHVDKARTEALRGVEAKHAYQLARAWDEGYERRAASLGMSADPNPYRAEAGDA